MVISRLKKKKYIRYQKKFNKIFKIQNIFFQYDCHINRTLPIKSKIYVVLPKLNPYPFENHQYMNFVQTVQPFLRGTLFINLYHGNIESILKKMFFARSSLLASAVLGAGFYLQNKKKADCCGIVGVLSKKRENVGDLLCQGIQLLKNRGYDSAGIVTLQGKQPSNVSAKMIKHADLEESSINCIQRVVQQVTQNVLKAHVGIGHTRWATCGQKVTRNAHPHYSNCGSIFLVHNGIIGNHSKIKIEHLNGVNFNSETDTEVIVQLLGKFKKEGKTIVQGLRQVEKIVSPNSQWGLVVIDKQQPDRIWTSTKGSPILIGLGDNEIFVASEVIAFQKHTKDYFETADGQIHELQIQSLEDLKMKLKNDGRLKVISNNDQVLKQPPTPYKRFYEYEIRRQAKIPFNPDFSRVKAIPFGPYMTLLGCGSSYFAACSSHYFFKQLKAFKKINILDPVELCEDDIIEGQTVVMISQSGQTKDLINIVQDCKNKENVKTIGIINVEGSTLARKVDFPIYIKVGREVAVAATKSFFHQTLNLIQFATEVAEQKRTASTDLITQIRQQLLAMPQHVEQTINDCVPKCKELAEMIYKKESIYLLAKRQGLAIAKQAALKIKQLNYIHAEALGACEMKHGPIALIQSDKKAQTAVILFVFNNETYEVLMNAVDQMASRNALVIIVTDCKAKIEEDNEKKKNLKANWKENYHFMIDIKGLKHMSHLLSLIPMQILVQQISKLKNINPDMPRNLAKTVTV